VKPHPDPHKAGIFVTELPDCTPIQSHQPFLTAARALLASGCDPETRLEMRHDGSAHAALTSTVGAAAKLTVQGDERFHRWKPDFRRAVASPMRFSGCPLPHSGAFVDAMMEG
jgi:hypothetical protein